jgi:spore coat polysaccharide biosynthesis protein SpsF
MNKIINSRLNEQEKFWLGSFGNHYINRNNSKKLKKNTDVFFKKIFQGKKVKISNIIELGANIGNNIDSLAKIFKKSQFTAVDINKKACDILKKNNPKIEVINSEIQNLKINKKFDLVLSKGVLIHINPNQLDKIYEKIFNFSKKYILLAEYYNPSPVQIIYRNKKNKLFKRDFAGEMIKKYKLKLVDYGFSYRYGKYPQDDLTWFLLKK